MGFFFSIVSTAIFINELFLWIPHSYGGITSVININYNCCVWDAGFSSIPLKTENNNTNRSRRYASEYMCIILITSRICYLAVKFEYTHFEEKGDRVVTTQSPLHWKIHNFFSFHRMTWNLKCFDIYYVFSLKKLNLFFSLVIPFFVHFFCLFFRWPIL